MNSPKWLAMLFVLWSALAFGQCAFYPSEQQKIDLILSQLQQGTQQTTPERAPHDMLSGGIE